MNLSIALVSLLTGAAAIGVSGAGISSSRGRKMSSHAPVESASSNSLTASTVARAQRSVELAVKTARSMADRKRRRQLIATRAALLHVVGVARRAKHERQRDLQDTAAGSMPSDMSDVDLSAIHHSRLSPNTLIPTSIANPPLMESWENMVPIFVNLCHASTISEKPIAIRIFA